jgi:hypothetical protein
LAAENPDTAARERSDLLATSSLVSFAFRGENQARERSDLLATSSFLRVFAVKFTARKIELER